MKLPNGYGTVYKLKGARRNPWCARKTLGYEMMDNGKVKAKYHYIGYYRTKTEALQGLAEFNNDPRISSSITFRDVYDKHYDDIFSGLSAKTLQLYKTAWNNVADIVDKRIEEMALRDYQTFFDSTGKGYEPKHLMVCVLSKVIGYAVRNEIISPSAKEAMRYLNIGKKEQSNMHYPFSSEEIAALWAKDRNEYEDMTLVLIYTGLRVRELLDMNVGNIHLDERWMYVAQSKTKNGIREVPIAEKIVSIIQKYMKDSGTLFDLKYANVKNRMKKMNHTAHDTRHTCVSLLVEADVDQRIIKSIVGHSGNDITSKIYTHLGLKAKLEAINRI